MWLAQACSSWLELVPAVLIVRFDVSVGDRHLGLQRRAVEQDVRHHPLLGHAVGVLLRLEPRLELVLRRLDRGPEAVGVGEHVLELHLLVAAAELLLHLRVAHRDGRADEALQALPQELAAQRVLEFLLGEALELQATADLFGAYERPVALELGRRRDRARYRLVGDGDPETLRLELDQPVGHQPLEDLLLDAELAEHVLVEPSLVEAVVHLPLAVVGPLELTDGDGQPANRHHRLPGACRDPRPGTPGCRG